MRDFEIPPFRPHPLLRGGHLQTLVGFYAIGCVTPYAARQHVVPVSDGDRIVLHDDVPPGWSNGDPAALLIHGLAGCHESSYMRRIAAKLGARGVRTFRMDLRGCGAGKLLAKLPYNAGRSDDARAVLAFIANVCPGSPLSLAGFSLGGAISLKMLGELGDDLPQLVRAVAVCPPVDLSACANNLRRWSNWIYDRHFSRSLVKQLRAVQIERGHPPEERYTRRPRCLFEFDDTYTAPASGFRGAADYYATCSSAQFIPRINRDTLILAAADDPLVPVQHLVEAQRPECVRLHVTEHGGHLGFIARSGIDADRRWLDWRVVDWLTAELPASNPLRVPLAKPVPSQVFWGSKVFSTSVARSDRSASPAPFVIRLWRTPAP